MGRDIGPTSRLCRREGMHLFLKGMKCHRGKCSAERRSTPPGQHGQGRIKLSDYGIQLREKQKVKRMYGLRETQFRTYFEKAQKSRGVTGHVLLQMLERRLDNVLYRAGFASSRREGRQIVSHQGIWVNNRRVNIPSFLVKVGDTVHAAQSREGQRARMRDNLERTKDRPKPAWLQVDGEQLKGVIVRAPEREDVGVPLQEQLIVELYSK